MITIRTLADLYKVYPSIHCSTGAPTGEDDEPAEDVYPDWMLVKHLVSGLYFPYKPSDTYLMFSLTGYPKLALVVEPNHQKGLTEKVVSSLLKEVADKTPVEILQETMDAYQATAGSPPDAGYHFIHGDVFCTLTDISTLHKWALDKTPLRLTVDITTDNDFSVIGPDAHNQCPCADKSRISHAGIRGDHLMEDLTEYFSSLTSINRLRQPTDHWEEFVGVIRNRILQGQHYTADTIGYGNYQLDFQIAPE